MFLVLHLILDKDAFGFRGYIIRRAFKANFKLESQNVIEKSISETLPEGGDVSIYIHFPFCRSLCPACPYVRYLYDGSLVEKYVEAIKMEISLYGKLLKDKGINISDIHVGGGTPSLLNPQQYKEILNCLSEFFNLKGDFDYGIEANPNDVNEDYLFKLRDAGVNKLSIGVQSFNDSNLKMLGRIHNSNDNVKAIENALKVDFKLVNIDMMYFLPNQSLNDWINDVKMATEFNVMQITLYPLLIVHYRPMYRLMMSGKMPKQPEKKMFNVMYAEAMKILRERGFLPIRYYSFSRTSKEYSTVEREMVGPLIAFGSGGMGFTGGCEYVNTCFPAEYIKTVNGGRFPIAGLRMVDVRERAIRYVQERLGALKLSFQDFKNTFNEDFHSLIGKTGLKYSLYIDRLLGNIKIHSWGIELTEKGMFARNWSGWAFVLLVPCGIVEKYLAEPWPKNVTVP
jgi:oxygen-independent coproporphyrinogen-3 oxidase